MPKPPENLKQFSSLLQLIKDLRGPQGCPWDKEQTHLTLAPYAIEETYEMVEALESGDDVEFCEELGDVLFQVVLHAEMAAERKSFNIEDVIESISEKLVRRHPHVFSTVQVKDAAEVITNWQNIKTQEKALKQQKKLERGIKPSQSQNVFKAPRNLPALQTADQIGEKTKHLGFDWNNSLQVLEQLKAEISELEHEIKNKNAEAYLDEVGDVLFSASQLARHLAVDSESALRHSNQKFIKRFNKMLELLHDSQKELSQEHVLEIFKSLTTDEKEKLWKKAKINLAR